MTHCTKNWSRYNITLHQQQQALKEFLLEKNFNQELVLKSLCKRRWYKKLCYFLKIFKSQSPEYLFKILPSASKAYNTRTNNYILHFSDKHDFFRNPFFHQLSLDGIT